MRRFRFYFLVAATACWFPPAQGLSAAPRAEMDAEHKALLRTHCEQCHGADTQESGVRVDDLPLVIDTIAAAERWQ